MSHTSQRRGLDPAHPGREMIVLAMVPTKYRRVDDVGEAMSELGLKMLDHRPANWLSKNFTDIDTGKLGPAQAPLEWSSRHWPEATERLLMRAVGRMSTVITALYTDMESVNALITDLKGEWLERNHDRGLPISIVLSGLFDDVHRTCRETGTREHTYLHSLGFFGKVADLPSESELEIITMCGHGLIAAKRVRGLVQQIKRREITAGKAAAEIARPCVCGIVNPDRAADVFARLSGV